MKLYVKNMVCPRCILSVQSILDRNGISYTDVRLGEIELDGPLTTPQKIQFEKDLQQIGFELLDDQRRLLIEKIKTGIIDKVQKENIEEHFSLSKYLSTFIFKDYSYLSKLFTEVEGITIEHFFILQKTEKVKEWLVYNELSLTEIANKLGYNSVQHLSTQFKKVTGLNPSQFKKLGIQLRKPIDSLGRPN